MLRIVTLSAVLATFAWAQDPIAPHSAMEPPAAKAAASLAASTKASPADLLTTGEKSDWNETAPYAEAVDISHRLERASRFVKVLDIGTTPEGRSMIALVVSKDRAFTPEAAARTGKVVMLIQSGIHADEIEGKDTALMLVRDIDVTWDMARNQDIAEPAGAWVRERFVPELDKRMAADGHLVG